MPIKEKDGGFVATYAGRSRTFKTKAAAEKWAEKYTGKTQTAAYKKGRPRRKGKFPRRMV